MAPAYWNKFLNERLARRRALAITGGTAAAAALLAACGGGQGDGGTQDKSGIVVKPEDTTKNVKRGGTIKDRNTADPPTLDIANPIAPLNATARHAYSTLVVEKPGYLAPSKSEIGPDFAESWEYSPDGLTVTMKLRQGVKWHNKAPVNARAADVEDVVFSWNRFASKAALRNLVANAAAPTAPVLSLAATDSRTIVIKLKEPLVYALELFASYGSFSGNMVIVPKETDGAFDIRGDMIGTGPFFLSNYQPSVGLTVKRNPDYWDKDFAYVDQIDYPIVAEYAAVLGQLKAGNIHHFAVRAEDITTIKRDEPRLDIYATDFTANLNVLTFGLLPEGRSPFLDERVRQAVSMSWDRDAFIDAFYNVTNFEAEGLPVQTRWNTHLGAQWEGWWLDPQGKDFGVNAKFFKNDIAEAKKLLAAAGHANGVDATSHYVTGSQLDIRRFAEAVDGMSQNAGFRIKVEPVDYAVEYIPLYRDGQGQYDGWAFHTVSGTTPIRISPVSALAAEYWSKAGVTFKGFSTSGRNDKSGDPQVDSLIEKARLERDVEKRRTLVHDIQRHLGKAMYGLVMPGGASGFHVAWPALRNFQVWSRQGGPAAFTHYKEWIDDTQPPFRT